jgi:hypothetical protein
VDVRHLCLDLHRALRGARRRDGLAGQRSQAADLELILLMPVMSMVPCMLASLREASM